MSEKNDIEVDDKELANFLGPLSNDFVEQDSQADQDPEDSIPTMRPPEPEYDPEEDRITVQPSESQVYPPPEFENPKVNYDPEKGKLSVSLNRNHENFGNQLRAVMQKVEEIRQKFNIWSKQKQDGENLVITFQFPPSQKND
ncbi:MAG: hypothetical protein R3B71_01140 [Candidatus Gracilibacteria bacterium]|nr:hypothetical protein [Candidatus Peregrinibacteria bacterium]